MSSSPNDRYGTGGLQVPALSQASLGVLSGGDFIMTRGMGKIISTRPFNITNSFLVTAGDSFEWNLGGSGFGLTHVAGVPIFKTLPLKTGDITNFLDSGTVANAQSIAHGLRTGDTIKIINSRTQQYLGNHVITVLDVNQFQIPVNFINADGFCRWEQVTVRVTSMSDAGGGKTRLSIVAHPFQDGNWINVRNTTNGINGTFQISNKQIASVDIDVAFTSTSTADLDVGIGGIRLTNPNIFNAAGGTMYDLQGQPDLLSFLIIRNHQFINFSKMGQTKDIQVNYGGDSVLINCFGHKSLGDPIVGIDTPGQIRNVASFNTDTYKAFLECDGTRTNSSVGIHLGRLSFFEFQSLINYPTWADPAASGPTILGILSSPSPGDGYKKAQRMRGTGTPIGSFGQPLVIPMDNTEDFRVNDTVSLTESSQANEASTNINTINKNVSVVVARTDGAHPDDATTSTVDDLGNGQIKFHAADNGLSMLLVGDTINVTAVVPTDYRKRYKVLAVANLGSTDPQVTVAGTHFGNLTTNGRIIGDAGILITNSAIKSQTSKDPQVTAQFNKGIPNSIVEGGFVATGTTSLTTLSGTYADLVFPATRTALASNQRINYTGNVNGEVKVTSKEKVSLQYPLTLTIDPSSAPDVSILIKLLINKGSGYVDLDSPIIEQEVFFKGTNVTTTVLIHVDAEEGDDLKVQAKHSSGTTNITIIRADLQIKS